jgi:hypothetical protein
MSTCTKTVRRKRILQDPSTWVRKIEDPLEDGILLEELSLDQEIVPKFSRQINTD